jgi:hypothetical protein
MTTETVTIVNVETGEVITRDANAAELAQLAADKVAGNAIKAALEQAEAAKAMAAAKLEALGLTADDLRALGL